MNANGSGKRNLTKGVAHGISPAWSPNGRTIAFAFTRGGGSFTHLWTMNPDGSQQRRLSRVNGECPDGLRTDGGLPSTTCSRRDDWDIWVLNADGSQAKPLVGWRGSKEQGAAWSPDGEWIAFQSTRDSQDGLPHIWLLRVAIAGRDVYDGYSRLLSPAEPALQLGQRSCVGPHQRRDISSARDRRGRRAVGRHSPQETLQIGPSRSRC